MNLLRLSVHHDSRVTRRAEVPLQETMAACAANHGYFESPLCFLACDFPRFPTISRPPGGANRMSAHGHPFSVGLGEELC